MRQRDFYYIIIILAVIPIGVALGFVLGSVLWRH